jgi:nucleotide-binding universal stress UspA family protein
MSGSRGTRQARIVVGVDGSEYSKDALRWAARQAQYMAASVEAVAAWQYPVFFGWSPAWPQDPDIADFTAQALDQAVAEVISADHPGWLRTRVAEGHAGKVLVGESAGADLLVVGSRGYGGIADALLGSVSTYCVHHARCPVTVIRPVGNGA